MKRVPIVLLLASFMLALAGCVMPPGVKHALYTAQITTHVTAREAGEATVFPYLPADPNETAEDKADRLQFAVETMTRTLVQVDKNLIQVVNWSRGFTGDLEDANSTK